MIRWLQSRSFFPLLALLATGAFSFVALSDTPAPGDFPPAGASLSPDSQREWLILEYAEPMQPKAIRIHETWNPGAVTRVSAYMLNGEEVTVWSGRDPTPAGSERGVSVIPL